jgi:hypothetical protein
MQPSVLAGLNQKHFASLHFQPLFHFMNILQFLISKVVDFFHRFCVHDGVLYDSPLHLLSIMAILLGVQGSLRLFCFRLIAHFINVFMLESVVTEN